MKKILLLFLCLLAGAQMVNAQTAYVSVGENHMTFRYDTYYGKPDEGYTEYLLNSGNQKPGWLERATEIRTINVMPAFSQNVKPTTMYAWFEGMTNLSASGITNFIKNVDTSDVTNMTNLFSNCSGLTSLDLTGMNTKRVTMMNGMFYGCTSLKSLNLSDISTQSVTNMESMFGLCNSLTELHLESFETSMLKYSSHMFQSMDKLTTIYVGAGWTMANVLMSTQMFTGCKNLVGGNGTKYNANNTDAKYARVDAAPFAPGYFTYGGGSLIPDDAYVVIDDDELHFCYDTERASRWYFNIKKSYADYIASGMPDHAAEIRRVVIEPMFALYKPTTTKGLFKDLKNMLVIKDMENLNTEDVTDMSEMFFNCEKLTSIDLSKINTSKVTNMSNLFSGCLSMTSVDVTGFDTKNVTNMKGMFAACQSLTSLDVSNFNTSKVTSMYSMFNDCRKLTNLNLNKFNTSNVTTMYSMFAGCLSLKKLSLSYLFSTANVTDMELMFFGCSSLTNFDFLTYFNTAKVIEMQYMFKRVSAAETLDLSSFDTKNVVGMIEMFRECSELRTIYIGSGWNTDKVTYHSNMFTGSTKIRGMQGTTYDASHVDKTYARLDEGTSNPGYLSTKKWGLWIGGVEVTDMNYSNIPITSGKAVYNRANTLSLTDATIDGSLEYGSIYCTNDYLTIVVNGTCTLNRSVNFHGADLYFTSNKDTDILNVKSYFAFKGSLRFYNKNTVINNTSSYTFMGDGTTSKLEFGPKASLFAMSSGKQMVIQVTALTFKSPTGFTFGSLGADDSQVSFDATQQTIVTGGQPLKGAFLVGQYYPLWFGDLQMSSTIPLYIKSLFNQDVLSISEADDGTLVMKTYPEFPIYAYNNTTFRSEAANLRVELGSDWTAKSEDANTPAMELKGNTTITGTGKLTVESAHEGINHNVRGANLTFDGLDIEINAVHSGIIGYMNFSSNNNPSFYNTLTFKDCTASITSKGEGNPTYSWLCIAQEKDLVLTGCHITNGVTFTNNSIYAPQVIIGLGGSYDLNGDGKVSTADIQIIINEMKKAASLQNMAYDLNGDGKISTADIQVIINEMKK